MTVCWYGGISFAKLGAVVALTLAATAKVAAAPVVYDFESFQDGDAVANVIPGLTFTRATVLEAGVSLNELEFPPRSGRYAVYDDGGAITIDFASSMSSVGAYFTYTSGLTLAAYDSGNNLLGTQTALFGANMKISGELGSSPNEFISFADAGGRISRVTITGDISGESYVMDDLTVDAGNAVPEPSTVVLALGLLGFGSVPGGWMRRRRSA